ncbi:MAG: NACHT domain-containing protein [Candidatus Aminicenantes bacterium]|nr:NACHT domain-containing protein [Candidatus Aminicenantes bacterium]
MKKETTERIVNAIPGIFKNIVDYTKRNFDEKGKEILGGAGGTFGVLVNLFGKSLIDKYFEKKTGKKLDDFGLQTYFKAALVQAGKSLSVIEDKLKEDVKPGRFFEILNESLSDQELHFKESDVLLIFQPKYHPAVLFVKDNYLQVLREIHATDADIKKFQRDFNENIENQIQAEFGNDYDDHLTQTEEHRLEKNETHFLWEMKELGRIGFKESENLRYEDTYARWEKVSNLRGKEDDKLNGGKNKENEKALKPVETLIEEYFNNEPGNHLEKILFIIADFGKGKSVFLRHCAAKLAKKYLEIKEGIFPVYFNLREFKNYASEQRLGVISDYLETKYSIKLDDDYFKKKRYVFLIDSLDESGELNKAAIDKVITSVKSIQGIDKSAYKTNRIIISSRPFDEGLSHHLKSHKPHIIKNKEDRDIEYFVSIYGFTGKQFNDWLLTTLKNEKDLDKIKATGFAREIIDSIKKQKKIDVYDKLVKDKTLSRSELRRPIFAYMIYQLILNNIDFSTLGKIGVYLSFLNLLTKDAKHIHDTDYRVNLKEEFGFRNLLHAIAALWMYKRQQGKQAALKKADICRVLDGEDKGESDEKILECYGKKDVVEIKFLSHSYFGENDNVLHFQHQSFAEILLAEYYLKVLIKYALDEEFDVEEARTKLILGEPTEQTIQFFKEMLRLLRETAAQEPTKEVIEKRRLLFPLMASLATQKNNRLFCHGIYYGWYKKCKIQENQTEYPFDSLKNWCIGREEINKIVKLCKEIMESKTNFLMTKAEKKTALYNKELLAIQNEKLNSFPPDMDRWLALLAGNELYNDEEKEEFFNGKIKNFEHLFDLIRNWNYAYGEPAPSWGQKLFKGIDMRENKDEINLSRLRLSGLDFSFSILKNLSISDSFSSSCSFNCVDFENFDISSSYIYGAVFHDIKSIKGNFRLDFCSLAPGTYVPQLLSERFSKGESFNFGINTSFFSTSTTFPKILLNEIFRPIVDLSIYGLQHSLFTIDEIKTWFEFESKEDKKIFFEKIDKLKKYEVKKKESEERE